MLVYAYTGDVKKLKKHGFKFGKLFASNYKCYFTGDKENLHTNLWMFVISKMVLEFDNSTPVQVNGMVDFILEHKDEPEEFWMKKGIFSDLRARYVATTNGNIFEFDDYLDYKIANSESKRQEIEKQAAGDAILEHKLMNEAGVFFSPIHIRKALVDVILTLHKLGLSKIEVEIDED